MKIDSELEEKRIAKSLKNQLKLLKIPWNSILKTVPVTWALGFLTFLGGSLLLGGLSNFFDNPMESIENKLEFIESQTESFENP